MATLSRFMIGCDECERWYHGPCVGVGKQAADSLDDYLCPHCAQAAGVPYAFGPPLPLPRLTRRPKLKYVATLLAEADEIGVETPEAELIRAIVARATEWQARANALLAALEGVPEDEEDEDEDEGGAAKAAVGRSSEREAPPSLQPAEAEAFLLEGEACEVEPEALGAVRKFAVQLSSWHARVVSILQGEHDVDSPLGEEERRVEALDPPPGLLPGLLAPLQATGAEPNQPAAAKSEADVAGADMAEAGDVAGADAAEVGDVAGADAAEAGADVAEADAPSAPVLLMEVEVGGAGSALDSRPDVTSPHPASARRGGSTLEAEAASQGGGSDWADSPRGTPASQLSVAVRKRLVQVEALQLSDVPHMSRDHIRAVLKREGITCKTSKADMQEQVRDLIENCAVSGGGTGGGAQDGAEDDGDAEMSDAAGATSGAGAEADLPQLPEAPVKAEDGALDGAPMKAEGSETFSTAPRATAPAAPAAQVAQAAQAAQAGPEAGKEAKVGSKRARDANGAEDAKKGKGETADGKGKGAGDWGEGGEGGGEIRRSGRDRDKERKGDVGGGVAPNSLAGVQRLLAEAAALGIGAGCAELATLRELLARAYRWRVAAREALREGVEMDEAVLDSLLKELSELPLRLGERSRVEHKLACKRWLLSRREQLRLLLQGPPPPLATMEALCGEAQRLGLAELPEVQQAQTILAAAHAWARRANVALRGGIAVEEMRQLHAAGEQLRVILPEQTKVAQRIDDTAQWAERAAAAAAARHITYAELERLLESATLAPVPPAQLAALEQREQLARWWMARATAAFVKDGCSLKLLACLEGDGRYELTGPDGGWCATLACGFCTGEEPAATSQFMIGCDKCESWYHGPCVGVGKQAADSLDDYLCPHCAQAAGVPYAFGPPLPLPRLTRRPKLKYVATLLAEADEIGVETPEAELIRAIVARATEWQARANALLDGSPIATSPSFEWAATARELVRESAVLEVEPEAESLLLLPLSRLEDWANMAASLGVAVQSTDPEIDLSGANGAWDNMEDAASLAAQASWLPLPAADVQALTSAVEHACMWRQAARQLLIHGVQGASSAAGAASGGRAPLHPPAPSFPGGGAALVTKLRALDEGRPSLHVLPEAEELRHALARHELMGAP